MKKEKPPTASLKLQKSYGPICHGLPNEAINALYLVKTPFKKQKGAEWSRTCSSKRWVSVAFMDGEVIVRKKEVDGGDDYQVKRIYYRRPNKRIIVSSIQGNYIKIVHLTKYTNYHDSLENWVRPG